MSEIFKVVLYLILNVMPICFSQCPKCETDTNLNGNGIYFREIYEFQIILNSDCCIIDKTPGIDRLLYAVRNETDRILDYGFKISVTLPHNENITNHYFLNDITGDISPTYLEFILNNTEYIIRIKNATNMRHIVSWNNTKAISSQSNYITYYALQIIEEAKNVQYLSLSACNLWINSSKLEELLIHNCIPEFVEAPKLQKLTFYKTDIWDRPIRHNEIFSSITKRSVREIFMRTEYTIWTEDVYNLLVYPNVQTIGIINSSINFTYTDEVIITNKNFTNLKNLAVRQCTVVSRFDERVVYTLFPNLENIDLSGTVIPYTAQPSMFEHLPFLVNAILTGTFKAYAEYGLVLRFANSSQLNRVDLSHNNLTYLEVNAPNGIKIFNISYNRLTNNTYSVTCFTPPCVQTLILLNNNFTINIQSSNVFTTEVLIFSTVAIIMLVISCISYNYRLVILSCWIKCIYFKGKYFKYKIKNDRVYKYDAFVIYSGHDTEWVWNDLVPSLEDGPAKYKLCLHERDFPIGSYITDNIEKSLISSKFCLVALTNHFIESEWCRWELELVKYKVLHENYEYLILIELEKLDDRMIPLSLKHLINTRTYLEWNLQRFNKALLIKRLRKALGKSIYMQHFRKTIEGNSEEIVLAQSN